MKASERIWIALATGNILGLISISAYIIAIRLISVAMAIPEIIPEVTIIYLY